MLGWASATMIIVGAGHMLVLALTGGARVDAWVDRGLWAVVPFLDRDAGVTEDSVTFWAGPGGFAVPLILLGWLVWHIAARGLVVPAGVGWVTAAWGLLDGVLLGPSPFFVLIAPGVLIALAARDANVVEEDPVKS